MKYMVMPTTICDPDFDRISLRSENSLLASQRQLTSKSQDFHNHKFIMPGHRVGLVFFREMGMTKL